MKKALCLLICAMFIISMSSPVFAETISTEPMEIEMDSYLLNAGYSPEFISSLDIEMKTRFYEGGYQYESSGISYGIYTEDYQIEYSVDSLGNIIMSDEEIAELKDFLGNSEAVNKVLNDKLASEENSLDIVGSDDLAVLQQTIDTSSMINSIDSGSIPADIMTLTNWTAEITCSHVSYNSVTKVTRKNLTYRWQWSYSPFWTLTDKVAMAWSGGFTGEPETAYWTYVKRVHILSGGGVYLNITDNGYGYDDYNPNAGVAKGIDITSTSAGSALKYHSGTLTIDLTKVTSENSRESAVGRYYHKQILPSLSLSFSETGPSISVSNYTGIYDQSPDSACAFWATTAN